MELVVRALRCPPPDQPQAIQARFNAQGGRIGRSSTCALPLPSPDRHISREHLEVRFRDGRYVLKVISKVNGVQVNDNLIPPGSAVELAHGDQIQIGEYVLLAELREPSKVKDPLAAFGPRPEGERARNLDNMASLSTSPSPPSRPEFDTSPDWMRPKVRPASGPVSKPASSDQLLESDLAAGALAKLLVEAPSASRRRPPADQPRAARRDAPGPPPQDDPARAVDAFLYRGHDPLGPPGSGSSLSEAAKGLFRQPDSSLPMPGSEAAKGPFGQPKASPPRPATAAPSPAISTADDIFSVLDQLSPSRHASEARRPPRTPPEDPGPTPAPAGSAEGPEEFPVPPPAAVPEGTAAAAVPGTELMEVLTQALQLEPGALDAAHPLETVRLVGELLSRAVTGLHQMLDMRAKLKEELHLEDRTMIAVRENNPLKHSESTLDALRYLVDLRQHGNRLFMQPNKSVDDAVADICAHQMAVMAGTRAALGAALRMFAPEAVEKRIKKTGALDAVVPALHKSKLWEHFLAMYEELEKEAEDHFDRLLNQEFARAYSEQGRKLRRRK